jgi:tryptophan halogenase
MLRNARAPLRTVAIAGDGPTGLATAIALRRALPRCEVIVISTPADPAALADQAVTLAPQSTAFLSRYGIEEDGLVVRAGGSHRMAVELVGWSSPKNRSLHPYGAAPPEGVEAPAVAAALAAAGRFAHPSDDPSSPLSDIDYALRINPPAYRRHLAALAAQIGIVSRRAGLSAAVPDGEGRIAHLRLADGETVAADLFVDCSGPAALVAGVLPGAAAGTAAAEADWSHILPCDRLLLPAAPRPPCLTPLDRITATEFGWRADVHGRDGTHAVFATHSATGSPDAWARAAGFDPAAMVTIRPGRRTRIWQANVVCIGDAAVRLEPLHWLNPALAHAKIALLMDLLPGRDPDPLEIEEFNRRAAAMADRARDYVALHYCMPQPPKGPFWAHAAGLARPESLQRTLAEFARRGRLPFFEEDIMPREAWIFAMASIGQRPAPTARSLTLPANQRKALAKAQQARAQAAVHIAPTYPEWLASYLKGLQ